MNCSKSWLRKRAFSQISTAFLLCLGFGLGGCHSAFVQASIQNHSGAPLQLIEVDYPSASFGAASLAPDADFQYRFKIQGSGNLKLSYTDTAGKAHQFTGPELKEGQEGKLVIVIDSTNSVHWQPALSQKQ